MLLLEIPLNCQTYQDQCSEEQLRCTVMAEQRKNNKYSAMAETQNAKFTVFHLLLKCMVDWENLPRSYLTRFPLVFLYGTTPRKSIRVSRPSLLH